MPALPPNNTARWFLDYNNGLNDHTMVIRSDGSAGQDEVAEAVGDFFTALDTLIAEITIVGLRVAAEGSNVTIPALWTGDPTYGAGALGEIERPQFLSFVGRDIDGRRTRVYVYALAALTENDYRIQAGDSAAVTNALTVLRRGGDGLFLTISGLQPFWNDYANVGLNAYWQRQARL